MSLACRDFYKGESNYSMRMNSLILEGVIKAYGCMPAYLALPPTLIVVELWESWMLL
jgi:hypothetical protein